MTDVFEITGAAHGGHGICRIDGKVCFVPYALPGDKITVDIVRRTRGVLWGDIRKIIEPSPHRIEKLPCNLFGKCGGCTWLHFAYPGQNEWKQRIVTDSLDRIGGIKTDCELVDDAELRLGYRTRAEFHSKSGRWGFFAKRSHRVIDVETCPLCHPNLNAAFAKLRGLDINGPVEITVDPEGDDVLVWTKQRYKPLENIFESTWSQDRAGQRPIFLFDGTPVVTGAFSQSSLLLQRRLVATITEMAGPAGTILDIYCGSGALSLGLAADRRVVGIDHNRAAITAASSIGTGEYKAGGDREIRDLLESESWDTVILDPPRTGAKTIIDALAGSKTKTIIYVACDPATLARDLRSMTEKGWRVDRVVVIDMFPNTSHVETVCLLKRTSVPGG